MLFLHKFRGAFLSLVLVLGVVFTPLFSAGRFAQKALAASDPVIAAAGDISCDPADTSFNGGNGTSAKCRQKYTSDLLVNAGLAAILDLGDEQYNCASLQAFNQSYNLSWGRVKSLTRPALGNHEYLTSGGTGCTSANADAAGYFDYFGTAAGPRGLGYYSYDIGAWHIIALNSNCSQVACSATSPQGQWLQADLASHSNMCTLAYWHHPRFSSGNNASTLSLPFWQLLYQYNADLVLVGHDHIYERFAPQDPNGKLDTARGIRQFTVGTGGKEHHSLRTIAANSEVRNNTTYGVLKLTLHPTGYDWQFVPEASGTFVDSGTAPCHDGTLANTPTMTFTPSKTPTQTPSNTPTSTFTPTNTPTVTLIPTSTFTSTPTFTPTDTPTLGPSPTSTDTPTASATFTPTNTPTQTSTSTNTSTPGPTFTSTSTYTPSPTLAVSDLIFTDGFESGNLSAWTASSTNGINLSVSPSAALVGSYGLQAIFNNTTAMYVRDDSPNAEPRYRARFYFDPNSIAMASGDYMYILQGYAASSTNSVLRIEFKSNSGAYQVRARALDNSAVWQNTPYVTITDALHVLEVDWAAATSAGANDGHLTFWVDGVQQGSLTGLANDTYRMESVRLGVPYLSITSTVGTLFFDAFESRRQSYIGP